MCTRFTSEIRFEIGFCYLISSRNFVFTLMLILGISLKRVYHFIIYIFHYLIFFFGNIFFVSLAPDLKYLYLYFLKCENN